MHCENRETVCHEGSQRFNLESTASKTRGAQPACMQATMQPLRVCTVFVTRSAQQDETQEHFVFVYSPNAHKQI